MLLGIALIVCGIGFALKTFLTGRVKSDAPFIMSAARPAGRAARGRVRRFVVGITSVGSGTFFGLVMLLVFPLTASKVVGTDIFHAAALLWVAGAGHLVAGNVDLHAMGWLLVGSIPGVLLGSNVSVKLPDRVLRLGLATTLTLAGIKLAGVPGAELVIIVVLSAIGAALLAMGAWKVAVRLRLPRPIEPEATRADQLDGSSCAARDYGSGIRGPLRPQRRRQHRVSRCRRRPVRRRLRARLRVTRRTRWEVPFCGRCTSGSASFARLIHFDKRGTGMSDARGRPHARDPHGRRPRRHGCGRLPARRGVWRLRGRADEHPVRCDLSGPVLGTGLAGRLRRELWAHDYPWGTPEAEYRAALERLAGRSDQAVRGRGSQRLLRTRPVRRSRALAEATSATRRAPARQRPPRG